MLNFSGTNTSSLTTMAKQVGLPLEVVNLNEPKVREIYERDFVLVRPDGHVAWRGNLVPDNSSAILNKVRGAA